MSNPLKIGDMIIYRHNSDNPYTGVIKEIEIDKWGFQHKVFIHWQGQVPQTYNVEAGFCGFNIRNLRNEFRLIRQ